MSVRVPDNRDGQGYVIDPDAAFAVNVAVAVLPPTVFGVAASSVATTQTTWVPLVFTRVWAVGMTGVEPPDNVWFVVWTAPLHDPTRRPPLVPLVAVPPVYVANLRCGASVPDAVAPRV